MSKISLLFLLGLSGYCSYAQTRYYHVDSAEFHLKPSDEKVISDCVFYKDSTNIEIHTWFHYDPYMLISDSAYFVNGILFKEQNLYGKSANEMSKTKLIYHDDTVFVTTKGLHGSYSYSAIKMSGFDSMNYPNSDMKLFGWSIVKSHSGQITDSIYHQDDQMRIYKQFHNNGQIGRHEYIENGEVKTFLYKENGRRIKGKNRIWNQYVNYPDSADVKYYSPDNQEFFGCYAEGDTAIVKMLTWTYYRPYQLIGDSSYYTNDGLIREQELYWFDLEKIVSDKFIYHGDTVDRESNGRNSKYFSQYIKTVNCQDQYSVYGDKTGYKLFGWSITIHDEGYVMDSTYYENDTRRIFKEYYDNGQLKLYLNLYDSIKTKVEYKRNGKLRARYFDGLFE
ncbi:hypothetical protein [Reichenbachiella sp. MALMAid0571]|uniref:hypothetical protein n=1 Tax=Reichenbachiella sp. MALMAid0571 TaxID=3143939 RepID=UPI0032DFEF22